MHVLVVEPDAEDAARIVAGFAALDPDTLVECFARVEAAGARLEEVYPDVILVEMDLPDGSCVGLLEHPMRRGCPTIVFTSNPDQQAAVTAMKAGAMDCVPKSPGLFEALPRLALAIARQGSAMVRLEQAETRLRHADRLIGAGRLAALTAHEVGTPLNVVRMGLQALQRDEDDLAESLGELIGQIDLVTGRLRGMLDYSRAPRPRIQIVSLLQTAAAAVTLVGPLVRRHGAEVTFAGEDVYVRADAEQVHQVVFNLITNSLDAGAKRITIEGASDPVYGTLRVSDDGPGVAPSARHRVFDAFYTTKEAGQGTGLGLAVCVQIAAEHGGWIELESSDSGAVFVFWLRRG